MRGSAMKLTREAVMAHAKGRLRTTEVGEDEEQEQETMLCTSSSVRTKRRRIERGINIYIRSSRTLS